MQSKGLPRRWLPPRGARNKRGVRNSLWDKSQIEMDGRLRRREEQEVEDQFGDARKMTAPLTRFARSLSVVPLPPKASRGARLRAQLAFPFVFFPPPLRFTLGPLLSRHSTQNLCSTRAHSGHYNGRRTEEERRRRGRVPLFFSLDIDDKALPLPLLYSQKIQHKPGDRSPSSLHAHFHNLPRQSLRGKEGKEGENLDRGRFRFRASSSQKFPSDCETTV